MSDLIRREDVLKLAKEGVLISNDMYRYAREIINSIPTAEPKAGKWIKNEHGLKCCSVCGKRPLQICYYDIYLDGYTGKDILTKYCPNCGAKMERSE